MDKNEIMKRVDHTLLTQTATWEEIERICSQAIKYKTASVCIPPSYVKRASEYLAKKNSCMYRDRISEWISDNKS